MFSRLPTLSGEQIRAARALARIDQSELARRCRLSLETIKRLERIRGPVDANSRTLRAISDEFGAIGIFFQACEDGGVGVCRDPERRSSEQAPPASVELTPAAAVGGYHRLIYYSTASLDGARHIKGLLDDIDEASRRNVGLEVTGILFACDGRFLSALEGPKEKVRQVYGAISCDPRHEALMIIADQPVPNRRFPNWSVSCGLFKSDDGMVGGEPALQDGFHPETLSPASAFGLLSMMQDLQASPPRDRARSKGACPLAAICLDRVCAPSAASLAEH